MPSRVEAITCSRTVIWVAGSIGGIPGDIKNCTHDGHVRRVSGIGALKDERIATKLAGVCLSLLGIICL